MNQVLKRFSIALYLLLTTITYSCRKFVEVSAPDGQLVSNSVFSDDVSATSAINGLYSQMMIQNFAIMNSGVGLYTALSGDELSNTLPDANVSPFRNNEIPANSSVIHLNFWKRAYSYIYHCNSIIEGLTLSDKVTLAVKNQIIGEAKLVRALNYFYLINLFGDVPFVKTTNYLEVESLPRESSEAIYDMIISDVIEAKELMSTSYPSSGKVRPNRWTASAFLARIYLYLGRWVESEAEATSVIDSGDYSLASLASVFLGNSSEAIWQLLPILSYLNTADGSAFIPVSSTSRPRYILTDWLLNAFEPGDQRKAIWIKSNIVSGQEYYYPFKYKVRSGSNVTEYNMVFRLAEMYLIRAEARAQQNNLSGAVDDLNQLRSRAGLSTITVSDQTELLTAIERERWVELFVEWGHRWFDLKRTQKINTVLGAEKPNWQPSDALFPIPLNELQLNPALTQNPGY